MNKHERKIFDLVHLRTTTATRNDKLFADSFFSVRASKILQILSSAKLVKLKGEKCKSRWNK